MTQKAGGLPRLTNTPDQTKIQVISHVSSPTRPYRILCSRRETHWCIWFGHPAITRAYHCADLAGPPLCCAITNHYRPRVKYTHNDINSHIPGSDSGTTGLCPIPPEHPQKKVVGDGGAKHRYLDPPWSWHSVADPHAASTIHKGGYHGLDPSPTPIGAYDCEYRVEATLFGKEFLRMAGIVQMLHAI